MKRIYLILLLISALTTVCSGRPLPASREEAERIIEENSADPAEGIWRDPASETLFYIAADPLKQGHYTVSVLETYDCRLMPGTQVGLLTPTADNRKFRLSLCSKIRKGVPGDPRDCAATLNTEADVLLIDAPTLKLAVSPSVILPRLWNTLRVPLRLRVDNPADNLPAGWVKVFPSYDGNGSRRAFPRVL